MAAVAAEQPPRLASPAGSFAGGASGSFSGSACAGLPARPASEIRYKEIAHYVGMSVVRNPIHGQKAGKGSHNSSMEGLKVGDLPSIQTHFARSERLKTQLEWLRAEQRAEAEQLRKLDHSISDACLMEKKAKQKIAKQQELRTMHTQRVQDVSRKIENIQGRISTAETSWRETAKPKSRELLSAGTSLCEDSKSTGGLGLIARNAELLSSAQRPLSERSWVECPDDGAAITLREGLEAAFMSAWSTNPSLPTAPSLPRLGGGSQRLSKSQPALQPPATAPAARVRRSVRRPESEEEHLLRPLMPSPEEEAAMRHESRIVMRQEMKEKCGGAKEVFRKLDLNGSGNISCQEFADGVSRLGINWQHITGLKRPRDLFNLFDEDKDSKITFQELFPDDVQEQSTRPSTPDFWRAYNRNTDYRIKPACWQSGSVDEELHAWSGVAHMTDDAQLKRKWMCSTMRRLKTRGKSDARCREVVALHLPRGTGPKDREGVNTYSHADLKNTKKQYSDEVNLPMRRMWKVVGDYKDQRREQKRIFDKLYSVTEAALQRQKNEETMASLGFSLLGKPMPEQDADAGSASGGLALLKANGYDDADIEDLRKDFLKFSDTSELLGKRGFTRLMQAILPSGQFSDRQADGWWDEALKRAPGAGGADVAAKAAEESMFGEKKKNFLSMDKLTGSSSSAPPRSQCAFDQFCGWWAEHQGKRS